MGVLKHMIKMISIVIFIVMLVSCSKGENKTIEVITGSNAKDKGDLINPVDIENLPSPDSEGRIYPNKKMEKLVDSSTEILTTSGIAFHDGYLLISDAASHCLYKLSLEGEILNKIGKLGSGPLEFSSPGELKWNDKKQKFYVVDEGNKRVQILSNNLEYEDEIDLSNCTFEGHGKLLSFAMDREDNLYFTYRESHLIDTKIHCITKGGKHLKGKDYFLGRLVEKDGEVYAMESYIVANIDEKIWKASYYPGQTAFYKMDQDKREKIADFPYMFTPDDMLWMNGETYFISNLWHSVDQLNFEKGRLNYSRSLSKQLPITNTSGLFNYTMATNGEQIFLAEKASGDIYILEP